MFENYGECGVLKRRHLKRRRQKPEISRSRVTVGGRSWKTCEPMRKDEKGGESETRVAILVPVRNYILETRFLGKTYSDKAQRFFFDASDKSSFTFDGKYQIHLTIQGSALV